MDKSTDPAVLRRYDGSSWVPVTYVWFVSQAAVAGLGTAAFEDVGAFQTHNTKLDALSNLAVGADKIIYATGPDSFATTDISAYARTILDDVDAPTVRTTLGLGAAAELGVSNSPDFSQNQADLATRGTINDLVNTGIRPIAAAYCTLSGTLLTLQRSSGISAVTRQGVGQYTATFSTPQPDTDYYVLVNADDSDSYGQVRTGVLGFAGTQTVNNFRVRTVFNFTPESREADHITILVWRASA